MSVLSEASKLEQHTGPLALQVVHTDSNDSFAFWYPTWETWKFRRTLAYWIAVLYLEGSILFTIGAAFSMTTFIEKDERLERAFVAVPYFVGGICFTLGSYVGVIEVINVPNSAGGKISFFPPCGQKWRKLTSVVSWKSVFGYMAFTIGALLFNVNTVAGFCKITFVESEILVWGSAIAGSIGFVAGSVAEASHNRNFMGCKVCTSEWQLCFWNLVGSIGLLLGSVVGACSVTHELEIWLVDLSYLIGSFAFWVGSTAALWMWKCENYGLGAMPEMNTPGDRFRELPEAMENMHAQYGCGRATGWQMPFLTMYLVNASASVLDIGLALYQEHESKESAFHRTLEALLNFGLSHGVMLLGSVVHHIPTAAPHKWLLIYMRIVLFFYTINSCLNVNVNADLHIIN
eukprot:gnl/MRDRNA2_/MRDRNA2_35460_c0_seq1.p1 gnl/MRDRNA2_/MRDRNA2_35460_c0~~gnl/MRDRNA2_/MRDRNA2_35460_c0_seq1.p1  ORF type:complete len:403 (+),score=72.20 gnl/MRDRNA2_/MRDRNA2_35460_c0_seq1:70-1278(+)